MGNIIAGKLIDRHLKRLLVGALLISVLALVMLTLPHRQWFSTVLLMLWGGAIAVIFVGLQTWVLRSAGDAVQPASAIYVAIFNAAIGCGALAGAVIDSLRSAVNPVIRCPNDVVQRLIAVTSQKIVNLEYE